MRQREIGVAAALPAIIFGLSFVAAYLGLRGVQDYGPRETVQATITQINTWTEPMGGKGGKAVAMGYAIGTTQDGESFSFHSSELVSGIPALPQTVGLERSTIVGTPVKIVHNARTYNNQTRSRGVLFFQTVLMMLAIAGIVMLFGLLYRQTFGITGLFFAGAAVVVGAAMAWQQLTMLSGLGGP